MKLIQKVEISYLRSLYKGTLTDIGDLSLIFGRNDSGKSNILRALNLFFNDETDVDTDIFFDIDFSDIRRRQAQKGASKQFFSIKITFNVPPNYRKSLGKSVYVKRQWNRFGEMTESVARGITKGTRIQLTKFLSSIDYTYIPAIKDAEVFQGLIQRMYDATAEGSGLQKSTNAFVASIRDETAELSLSLSSSLGATAKLAAPTDMGLLFRSLDFSHGEDEHSLLLQKGDGIKARHIPELLRYINDNETSARLFIWGFEEPENSLDLAAAGAEALNFAKISCRNDTQIFITSHSPAFYLSESNRKSHKISRYFVSKQKEIEDDFGVYPADAVSPIENLDDAEEKMRDASLMELPYVIRGLRELKIENENLSKIKFDLQEELNEANRSIIFVEGDHDKKLFEKFLKNGSSGTAPNVKTLGGTPSNTAELVKRVIDQGGSLSSKPSLFLFDNDEAGRQAYRNLTKLNTIESDPTCIAGELYCWNIPVSDEFKNFYETFSIQESKIFFPAEFLFDGQLAAECYLDLMSSSQIEQSRSVLLDCYHKSLSQPVSAKLRLLEPGSKEWFWTRGVHDSLKEKFFEKALSTSDMGQLESLSERIMTKLGLS